MQSFFEAPEFDHVERKDGGVSNGNDNGGDVVEMAAVNCLQEF